MSDTSSDTEHPRNSLRPRPSMEKMESEGDDIDVAGIVTRLLSDRKNSNLICDLLRLVQTDDLDDEEMFLAVSAIEKWLTQQINDGLIKDSNIDSKKKYSEWVVRQLKVFVNILCGKASDPDFSDIIFPCLIRLYKLELTARTKHVEKGKIVRTIAKHLCSFEDDRIDEIEKFNEFFLHPDFLIEILKGMQELMDYSRERNEVLSANVIFFLQSISDIFPEKVTSDLNMSERSSISTKSLKSGVQNFVTSFLRRQLTDTQTKKILLKFPIIFPMMSSPLVMADYIVKCYDSPNSAIALLALNAIFTLVTEHNFEYPEFFCKVYRLLNDDVVYAANRVQFLHMIDMFLASPLLPQSYQAGFTKRLSRLALHAPAPVALAIMPVIFNLIRRTQSLRLLINRPNADVLESDPYDHNCMKIEDCRATESSLWELESLRRHFIPEVKRMASQITTSLGRDLDSIPLDVTYQNMTQKIFDSQKKEEYPLTIDKPSFMVVDSLFVEG